VLPIALDNEALLCEDSDIVSKVLNNLSGLFYYILNISLNILNLTLNLGKIF